MYEGLPLCIILLACLFLQIEHTNSERTKPNTDQWSSLMQTHLISQKILLFHRAVLGNFLTCGFAPNPIRKNLNYSIGFVINFSNPRYSVIMDPPQTRWILNRYWHYSLTLLKRVRYKVLSPAQSLPLPFHKFPSSQYFSVPVLCLHSSVPWFMVREIQRIDVIKFFGLSLLWLNLTSIKKTVMESWGIRLLSILAENVVFRSLLHKLFLWYFLMNCFSNNFFLSGERTTTETQLARTFIRKQ